MGRPTIARSIKRRRLRELGENHLYAGVAAPSVAMSIECDKAAKIAAQDEALLNEEAEALAFLASRGYNVQTAKRTAKKKAQKKRK